MHFGGMAHGCNCGPNAVLKSCCVRCIKPSEKPSAVGRFLVLSGTGEGRCWCHEKAPEEKMWFGFFVWFFWSLLIEHISSGDADVCIVCCAREQKNIVITL